MAAGFATVKSSKSGLALGLRYAGATVAETETAVGRVGQYRYVDVGRGGRELDGVVGQVASGIKQ
ncbi:hypothetical protein AZH11_18825 [Pseudomonas simiae]|nr:hypothetical protein AZH11_18825 [Pseudomonas simiae]